MKVTIFPVFAPIYRRRPYCVVDFRHFPKFGKQSKSGKKSEETRNFENLKFCSVVDFRHFPRFWKQSETGKKRETSKILKRGTKNGHTVWPPPINGRAKRTISGKIVVPFVVRAPSGCGACFGVGGCCLVVAMCARAGGPPAAQRPPAPRAVRRRRAAPQGGCGPAARRRPTAAGFFRVWCLLVVCIVQSSARA